MNRKPPSLAIGIRILELLSACLPITVFAQSPELDFFKETVQPLLQKNCFECHSHGAKMPEGGLVLDSRSGWENGGDSGPAIVPGKPGNSLLLKAISYVDDDLRMPPNGQLSESEIAMFRKWITDGAIDPRQAMHRAEEGSEDAQDLWSLKPRKAAESKGQTIDSFISEKLRTVGLKPNEEAKRETLLRRASFGLTGLPPTPDEIRHFLSDRRPDAWERLIVRLLNSPRYGERWGRHWLDLARYGDSNGGDINYAHGNAWRYRDYVIQAFNNDKPYDDFIREQLAGDLMTEGVTPKRRAELFTATGFLLMGPKMLAEVDGQKLLIDIVDEQLDVAGKTFLGMTFGCARCHDHKFDPITARDYYAMAGIFRSTKVMASHRPQKVVGEWVEIDVTTPSIKSQTDKLKAEKKELESQLAAYGAAGRKNNTAAAARSVVVDKLPTLRSTTWAARVRIDTPQSLGCAISATYPGAGQGHSLGFDRINNGKTPRVVWNHGSGMKFTIITARDPIALGQWHHLAVTYDANTRHLRLYVNGEPAAERQNVSSTPFNVIGVGRREAAKEFQLLGDIDDVVVYDTALTEEEIVILDARQKLEQRPVFRWNFEEVKDDEVVDSENRYNGRLVGLRAESNLIDDGFDRKALSFRVGQVLNAPEQKRLDWARARLKAVDELMPASIKVMAARAGKPMDLPIHIRGSHTNPSADTIPRTSPSVFKPLLAPVKVQPGKNGRLELAEWIVNPKHPLTARVMVNRIWQQHFGEGLVRTASNFGGRGEEPSHPELLDWLAEEFVNNGWSIKHMHRLIMSSDAYRRSSSLHAKAAEKDADNRLLARFPIRRLEAEAIRDSLLAASGELEFGSPGNLMNSPNMKRVGMTPADPVYQSPYRGVYLPAIRVRGYAMFSIFDVSDTGHHVSSRPQTMVAQQALFLLNNPFVIARAKQVAVRIQSRQASDEENIEWLHRLLLGRRASTIEFNLLKTHLRSLRRNHAESAAWQALAHSLFCSNEFIHVK